MSSDQRGGPDRLLYQEPEEVATSGSEVTEVPEAPCLRIEMWLDFCLQKSMVIQCVTYGGLMVI